jgi:hypothetical protein
MAEQNSQPTDTPDEPLNELESKLLELMSGQADEQDFLRVFLQSDLYIMVDGDPQGDTLGDRRPMVVATAENAPRMMAVFSNPSRAARLVAMFADYSFPIMGNTTWVLEHIGPHMGIAFNPGCPNGFELAPEGAQALKNALAAAESAPPAE